MYYGFDLDKQKMLNKRAGFKQFNEHNFKKYFYCVDVKVNELIKEQAIKSISKLLLGDDEHLNEGDSRDLEDKYVKDGDLRVFKDKYYDLVGIHKEEDRESAWLNTMKFF